MDEPVTSSKTELHRNTLILILCLACAVVLIFVWLRNSGEATPFDRATRMAMKQAEVLDSAEQQRDATARAAIQQLVESGEDILRSTLELEKSLKLWNKEHSAVLQDDNGRLIAADFESAKRFRALTSIELPGADYGERQRKRVNQLLVPLRTTLKHKTAASKPDEQLASQLGREDARTEAFLLSLREVRSGVEALIAEAKAAGCEPSTAILASLVSDVDEYYARLRSEELARVRDDTERTQRQRLAELERRKMAEIGRAERARREAELEAQRVREQTQARLSRENSERERLKTLARSAEVQARYQVFLAKGRFSFRTFELHNTASFRPSYNALQVMRVLTDYEVFAKAAVGATISMNIRGAGRNIWHFNENDRPLWPSYPRNDAQWKELYKRFLEFQELAPIWRDMGMLRP